MSRLKVSQISNSVNIQEKVHTSAL